MRSRRFAFSAALGLGAILSVGLSGCGSGSSANGVSEVRFLNALINGPSNGVDFVQRNATTQPTISGLTYDIITPSFQQGGYDIVAAGGNANLGQGVETDAYVSGQATTGTKIAGDSFALDAVQSNSTTTGKYTIVLAGDATSSNAAYAPALLHFFDGVAIPAGTSNTYVRVINLSPDSPSGGLSLANNGAPITGLTGIQYKTPSSYNGSAYIPLPVTSSAPFSFTFLNSVNTVIPTSTTPINGSLLAGHAYTIFTLGYINASSGATGSQAFNALVVQDQ